MLDRLETKYAQTQGAAPAALDDEQALPQVAEPTLVRVCALRACCSGPERESEHRRRGEQGGAGFKRH